jgi:hypothetical protein
MQSQKASNFLLHSLGIDEKNFFYVYLFALWKERRWKFNLKGLSWKATVIVCYSITFLLKDSYPA